MMLENKEAVIFDLDGTITDSMWVWADIDRTFFEQRKIPMPPTLNKEIEGMSFTETAEYFIRTFQLPETVEELKDPKTGIDPAGLIMEFQGIDIGVGNELAKRMETIAKNS